MATMREVAAQAGVSAKTVSRVFNEDPHVLPETRAHVERVMHELNYVPNVMATTFRSGRSSVIGVAVPDAVDPFFAAIARAVDDVAARHGLSTLVTSLGDESDAESPILESLLSRQLSGLIVAPVGTDHSWMKRWQQHTPVVFVDRGPLGLTADSFTEDDEGGAVTATRHLIDHGYQRIAYVGDMIHLSTETKRLAGYRRALHDANITQDDDLVVADVSSREAAGAAVGRLRALADPATAIFSANARCSMVLAAALHEDPLPIVGFGDFPLADLLKPSMTVIDQSPVRLGQLAATRVFDRLDHPQRRLKRVNVLDVSLIERESCFLDASTD